MKRIVIIGGGFAGLWSAVGAARKLHELQIPEDEVEIMVINRDAYLGLRPRYYEKDPHNYRIPLSQVLDGSWSLLARRRSKTNRYRFTKSDGPPARKTDFSSV